MTDAHDFDEDAVHGWFELSYAAYLVLPRSVLQSLPGPLQRQLVDALEAIRDYVGWQAEIPPVCTHYEVMLRRDEGGRYVQDRFRDYERGRRHVSKEEMQP